MAKKSAKSKGYRRQNAKKPYLSRRDIALLCALIVIIGVGAFFLFRYDDGALKVQDGAVVKGGDDWLIANGANTRGGRRYYKLGEVGELDGYTREAKPTLTDANLTEFEFTANDADAPVDGVTITATHAGAEAMAKYAASTLEAAGGTEVGDVRTEDLGGRSASCFFFSVSPAEDAAAEAEETPAEEADETEETPAEEAEETSEEAPAEEADEAAEDATEAEAAKYQRTVCAYIDADHNCCVVLRCEGGGETAEDCPTDEQLMEALEKAVAVVALESSGK